MLYTNNMHDTNMESENQAFRKNYCNLNKQPVNMRINRWSKTESIYQKKGKIMKKRSVRLASLVLFFATGAAIGMRPTLLERVYLENQLTSRLGAQHQIKATVTHKDGSKKGIIVAKRGEKQLLGDIKSITNIQVERYVPNEYTVSGLLEKGVKSLGYFVDDITYDFLTFVNDIKKPAGPDMIITVQWKAPTSNTDYTWKYTISTGTVRYPWSWVINNTGAEIQIQEIVDPNSLYAREMAEQGIKVGNPVNLPMNQRFELFEENKRFKVYSKVSGWFEPDYVDLEQQVIAGRKLNPEKFQ